MNAHQDSIASLTQIIHDAEKAVNGIADFDLKKIAFDRLLERLFKTDLPKMGENAQKTKAPKPKIHNNGLSKPGPTTWIRELAGDGFFTKPKTSGAIREALNERGHILSATDLTRPLEALVQEKRLRRRKMPNEEGGKDQLHWHNW